MIPPKNELSSELNSCHKLTMQWAPTVVKNALSFYCGSRALTHSLYIPLCSFPMSMFIWCWVKRQEQIRETERVLHRVLHLADSFKTKLKMCPNAFIWNRKHNYWVRAHLTWTWTWFYTVFTKGSKQKQARKKVHTHDIFVTQSWHFRNYIGGTKLRLCKGNNQGIIPHHHTTNKFWYLSK